MHYNGCDVVEGHTVADMVSRRASDIVRAAMRDTPVVAIQGPRTVGKTTLLAQVADVLASDIIDLDDPGTREAVQSDPRLFVQGPSPVCIDEYQYVPEILDAIKAELNRDGSPGRFLLTGSTRHDALPQAAQALTGRLHVVTVLPLSQGELAQQTEHFMQDLLHSPTSLATPLRSQTTRDEYIERVCAGGFPMVIDKRESARNQWFDDYVQLTLERDVMTLSSIRQRDKMPDVLARLAGQTAQVLNVQKVAERVGLHSHSAGDYTKLLEAVFLVHRLEAWGKTLSSRSGALPKLHVVDSGLAARQLRLSPSKLRKREVTSLQQFGYLLETFVVGECRKQLSWMEGISLLGHWRTHDGVEVDLVVETDDGQVAGIEVKAGSRVSGSDLAGLRLLRDKLGDRFVAGVALYTGQRSYTSEDRIHVLPIDRMWAS